ncbi:hypothetical protein Vretifemale_12530, partial [Volvox reticuliferus]
IRVTRVRDGEHADTVVLAASSTQVNVVAAVVVHACLGEHGIVLHFALADSRAVVADDHQLGLARAKGLQAGLVAQSVLATLHHQRETRVDVLLGLLRLLSSWGHFSLFYASFSASRLQRTIH